MNKTPAVRFIGFAEDWEQRKLGDMGSTFNGLSGKTKDDFGHGEAKFITYMNVFSNPIADLTMTESIEIDKKQKSVKAGDVFFTTSSETPDEVGMSSVMPEDADNIYLNSFCFGYRPTEKFDLNYLAYVLRADSFRKEMIFLAQGISRYNISKNKVMEVCIPVPTIEEQTKVGRYFRNLDHLITLHQCKYDKLTNVKKSMLEKMFPKNGSNVPEIRFKGFTDAWEQRKLGDDLVSIHTGTNLLGSITNTGMPLIKMGNIQRGYFDTSKVEFLAENEQPDKADIANYGDFFFNTRNTLELVGKGATWMKNSGEYAFNSNIARFELRNLDTIFFNYLYNTDYMTKQIHARAMGTTSVAAIYPRTLDSVEYLAPCMKEQQKIGAYFKQLDHLITLHHHKLEKLEQIKQAMLHKMFV